MKQLLLISLFTTLIVISWIGFGIHHNTTTSTISRDKEIIITPIPDKFDQETVNKIRERKVIEADLSTGRRVASGSSTTVEDVPIPEPLVETNSPASPAASL